MTNSNMVELVSSLRNIYPVFEIENIVNDLERSLESTGILVKYADMGDLSRDNITVNGYGYADKKNRPIFVLDGNSSYFKRRETMAHLLGQIIMHHSWLPGSINHNVSKKREIVYIQEESRKADSLFMMEFLLPNGVENFIDKFETKIDDKIIRNHMIFNILSGAYKVTEEMVKIKMKLKEENNA